MEFIKLENKTLFICLIIILFFSISSVNAGENDTLLSNNDDENIIGISGENDNLTADVGTYTELEQAFLSNDKFVFEKDYAAHSGDGIINIKRSIEIDGKGHTIDAGGFTGIFQSDSSQSNGINVVIKNLIFKNAKSENGGAIKVINTENVHYTIDNCTFIKNQASLDGGAIYFESGHSFLDISNTIFKNSHSDGRTGGAISLVGESRGFKNLTFENNEIYEGDGAAIYIRNNDGLELRNCNFDGNRIKADSSGYLGGAICNAGYGNLRIIKSNFTNNELFKTDKHRMLDSKGGAVYSTNRLELDGCVFIGNRADDHGGAVYTDKLLWLENPSTFINNYVKNTNTITANKGGAIYASTFENIAYGHTFINNSGYYGGAIYINNKNDVTFQSCYFEGNTAMVESKTQGSGAAIYVDSSGSTVTMVDNIFLNNKATSDNGVFNCGKYRTVANNWWGTNDPKFSDERYIVEWHRVGSNTIVTEHRHLRAYLSAAESPDGSKKLTVYFINNQGEAFNGKLTNLNAEFSSNKGGKFTNKEIGKNNVTVSFTLNNRQETVSAKINNQILTLNVNQTEGDFAWLQNQIDATSGTLNLERDITYTIGLDTITEGIKIAKPITINGNGHIINALGKSRIFDISDTNDVVFNNITFINGFTDTYAGAIKMDGVNNVKILNSNFMNNTAEESAGAILAENGNGLTISNCVFINNKNNNYVAGAIHIIRSEDVNIEKSKFTNNSASDGGAIAISGDKNISIDGCEFRLNTAFKANGGAIYNDAEDVAIKNSVFLNNKAKGDSIEYKINAKSLTLALVGGENYINAIESYPNIKFFNVTYWNGKVTTANNPKRSSNESGININLVIKDSQNRAIKNVTLTTDANGQAVFSFDSLKDGKYTFNATHFDDNYYTQVSEDDEFTVSNIHSYPSEVKINIKNGTEFKYGNVKIPFEVTNRTFVEVVITNSDFIQVLYDNETNLSYVVVDLPVSDEYYNIIVFNQGNGTYEPSSAEKAFKIVKTSSKVKVNPIADVKYSDPVTVKFTGDASSYNVTVYDSRGNKVFNRITSGKSVKIPGGYAVGTYNVTVVAMGDENRTESKDSTKFNIIPKENNIVISADDAVYGNGVVVYITATADGKYTAHINSTDVIIDVNNGYGSAVVDLAAGKYITNVSFNRPDYINVIEAYNFTVTKAQSNVEISMGNVTADQNTSVSISDDFPTEYNVIIRDSKNKIVFDEVINTTSFVIPSLNVGRYNLTVTNIGNENITGSKTSRIFDVTKDNYVSIMVEDEEYGRELVIMVFAEVDGNYTVDINGTKLIIEVIDGFGYDNTLELDAGEYYANVTFDNSKYINIIENTTFTVYMAESNIQIDDIENVTYGEDVTIEYYDNYNATFTVVVFDENDEAVWEFRTNATKVVISDLAAGNYTLMITNEGDKNIIGMSEFKNFTVYKATPKMKVTTEGNEINVKLPKDATGEVSTVISGKEESYPVVDGIAIIPLYHLKPGNYSFNVKYSGDKNYTGASGKTKTEISKITPEMTVKANEKEISVVLPDDATGSVKTTVNGKEITAAVSKGKATIPLGDLNPGNYTFDVRYLGNDKYYPRSEKTSLNIPKIDPNMNASFEVNEIVVELPEDATGEVTTTINGIHHSSPVVDGLAIIPLYDVKPGNYTLNIKYSGDDKYLEDNAKIKAELYKVTPEMTVSAKDNVINVVLPDDATGNVTVNVDGKEFTAPVKNGKATITVSGLEPGKYSANVKYSGNDYYYPRTEKTSVSIPKIDPNMNASFEENEIIVELPEDATGNVTTTINGIHHLSPVVDGLAIIPLYDVKPGNYTLDIKYSGDDKYLEDNAKVDAVLDKVTPEMTVSAKDNVINVVLPDDATGNVTVNVDGKEFTAPVKNGKATITVTGLEPGKYSANVKYSGNDYYYPRTEKTSVSIPKIDPNMNASFEENEIIVELPEDATGEVTTTINGIHHLSPVVDGLAIIPLYDVKPGNYTLDIKYSGDDKYLEDNAKVDAVLDKVTPEMTVSAKDNVINVVLPDDATGNVTVNVGGKVFTAPVKNGKATITVSGLEPGKYSASVKYSGNDNYYPRSEKTDVTIPKIAPDMKVHKNNDNIIVELPQDATGNVILEVAGEKLTAPVENGKAEFSLEKVPSGEHDAKITYSGDDKYKSAKASEKIVIDGIELVADDVVKYFSGSERLVVTLLNNDKPVKSKEINITLNGVTYSRITDDNGQVSLGINLVSGNYTALVETEEYSISTLVDIEIKSTVYSNDLVKMFRNATQYYALFLDGKGNPLANTDVIFNIHGVFYTRTTNATGWAKLNINLEEGKYIITAINTKTGESKGYNITVLSLLESGDLIKYYKNDSQFVVRVHSDDGGWAKEGEEVLFNINGVFYVRITNETGHVKLNINLNPGEYIITADCKGCYKSNSILVLPTLTAEDLNMKYKDGSKFTAKVVDGQGKPYPNQNVSFNVNGVFYTRTTDANGEAKLNINLMAGEYIITSGYNGAYTSNKITISS